jgi:hypothetical protein
MKTPHPFLTIQKKARLLGLRFGADDRIRTCDPFITSEVLYQLSYISILYWLVEASGVEPLSEDIATPASPSAVTVLSFRLNNCPVTGVYQRLATKDSLSDQWPIRQLAH